MSKDDMKDDFVHALWLPLVKIELSQKTYILHE